jgi:protein gp37
MGSNSKIEWCEATWNPVRGCSMAPGSETGGCLNCYAARQAARALPGMRFSDGSPLAVMRDSGPRWTGRVELQEHMLDVPLRRKKPTMYFVNSMSDLFHEGLADADIDQVFAVMQHAYSRGHVFQILTKRSGRMREYFAAPDLYDRLMNAVNVVRGRWRGLPIAAFSNPARWPLPRVWLGVSCEDQATADARIPLLLQTPAAVRFVSAEPLLGPVGWLPGLRKGIDLPSCMSGDGPTEYGGKLDWVIVGGESGPGARPLHPDWARSIRNQCVAAGVPFFFKQNGEFVSCSEVAGPGRHHHFPDGATVRRVGKRAAGALLDGREWRQMPEAATQLETRCPSGKPRTQQEDVS